MEHRNKEIIYLFFGSFEKQSKLNVWKKDLQSTIKCKPVQLAAIQNSL